MFAIVITQASHIPGWRGQTATFRLEWWNERSTLLNPLAAYGRGDREEVTVHYRTSAIPRIASKHISTPLVSNKHSIFQGEWTYRTSKIR